MPLTQKQLEYLALAWQCFDAEPKIDYDKFHQLANLASPHSAREMLRVTRNKLRDEYGNGGGNDRTAKPSTPRKKSGNGDGNAGDADAIRFEGTPRKASGGGVRAQKKGVATPVKAGTGSGRVKVGAGTMSGAKRGRKGGIEDAGGEVEDEGEDEGGDRVGGGEESPSKKMRIKAEVVDEVGFF